MSSITPETSNPATSNTSAPAGLPTDTITAYDPVNPISTLINVNVSNVTKLTATNYITWSVQIKALLQGYNLDRFLDPAQVPAATVIVNNLVVPNPEYQIWFRQDRLIFSALLGSISSSCQALVASAPSSAATWTSLANTYGRSSRGHLKQIKEQMKRFTKGPKSINDYMHFFKIKSDELALLGKPMDHEDLLDMILAGLDDNYKPVKDIIQAKDTSISFIEFHEKLLSHEVDLIAPRAPGEAYFRPPMDHRSPRPQTNQGCGYQGKCQLCGIHGHSAKFCRLLKQGQSFPQQNSFPMPGQSSGQPSANPASFSTSTSQPWLLDSGASHHVTTDLANLSFHTPYSGNDEVKDLATGAKLATGKLNQGVYEWPISSPSSTSKTSSC
ncbi:PREDICTED: uncharacterized protein LOC109116072 [Tarenaya hassleriana]|uniref:uncharacterized protein LOC109116072 n=1 Tax=Tarenaya hassleriana TaxID=28532 RepID=UPI0008FD40B5|nr:PREDICTED: uncharacterized protein LOC109116072 [Tarenaya hassleriana]